MRFGPPSASSIRMATARGAFPSQGLGVQGLRVEGLGSLNLKPGLRGLGIQGFWGFFGSLRS